ncbi:MAG: FG-GAP-like repeat-containing protein, partial [Planctomycetota bacterium]
MRSLSRPLLAALVALVGLSGPASLSQEPATAQDRAAELETRRLLGKAYYENAETPPQFEPAAKEFRRCIELVPHSAVDHFNLGLVLMRAENYDEALKALNEARRLDPELPAATYVAGIVHKRLGQAEAAVECLAQVTARDPNCAPAYFNLGLCYKQLRENDKALVAFKRAVELAPGHPSYHYQLMILYRSLGEVDNVQRHKEIFDQVKDTIDESEKTAEALERSQYSYIITTARSAVDLTTAPDAEVRFVEATAPAGLETHVRAPEPFPLPAHFSKADYDAAQVRKRYVPSVGGAVRLGDFDGDGDLDLYVVNCAADPQASANRLYRNDGRGAFTDITEAAGVGDKGLGLGAIVGDYDNDGHNDLYVVNCGPNVLYRNKGDGTFEDVSAGARVDEPHFGRAAAFVDYDHDNDLDLFVGNDLALDDPPNAESFTLPGDFPGEANALLRNNGNGTFTDLTDEAGLLVDLAQTQDLLFADFDADHDVDLFIVNANAPS